MPSNVFRGPLPWWAITRRARCPHVDVAGIYGDAIIHARWFRLRCRRCGRFLDGPVLIAVDRAELLRRRRDTGR